MNDLDDIQRRAADLQARIDAAPDEPTARALADQLHQLLDSTDNVAVLGQREGRRSAPRRWGRRQ